MVFGSSTAAWRDDLSSGKTLAEGWSEPFLQKAGLSMPRTLAESQTRRRDMEAAIALGLLGFIVWWTVPKKKKESPEDSKDGSHGS